MYKSILFFLLILTSSSLLHSQFQLKVNNGTGSGTYSTGDTVHVWANTPNQMEVFTSWVGSGAEYLTLRDEWHTFLIVPEGEQPGNLEITAQYAILPKINYGMEKILLFREDSGRHETRRRAKKPVFYFIPPHPKAVVFLFHGTNGSGYSMAMGKYESGSIIKDLLHNGYACVMFSANEADFGDQNGDDKRRWKTRPFPMDSATNIDLKNLVLLEDQLRSKFHLDNLPFYAFGVSNGAVFSDLCAPYRGYRAVGHMVGNGSIRFHQYIGGELPTIWLMAENDHQANADSAIARTNYQAMLDRGIDAEWYLLEKSPVYASRFTRSLKGITADQSKKIAQTLKQEGYLTPDKYLNFDILEDKKDEISRTLIQQKIVTKTQSKEVIDQLKIVNADHGAHGDYNKRIIAFFDRYLTLSEVDAPLKDNSPLQIYPNPASTWIFLNQKSTIQQVNLFNLQGQLIHQWKGDRHQLNIFNIPSGTYILDVRSEAGKQSGPVVIE